MKCLNRSGYSTPAPVILLTALMFVLAGIVAATPAYAVSISRESSGQVKEITGSVNNEAGEALAGVSVSVKGVSGGTVSDGVGHFAISVPAGNVTLVFSYVGYETLELAVGNQLVIHVTMTAQAGSLGEVVVVGYGTQKKVSMTSAVSEIKGEELLRRPVASIEQSLQGQLPGLTILDQGGSPGNTNTTIRVRGVTTLSNNNPLVIIDGIEQPFSFINPDDVESISICSG